MAGTVTNLFPIIKSDVGMKVSLPGVDALSNLDPRKLPLWSRYQPLKIIKYGSGAISCGANSTATLDIVHGLGYAPLYLAYYDIDNNGRFWLDQTQQGTLSVLSTGNEGGDPSLSLCDRYKIRFSVSNQQGNLLAFTAPFRYLLFDQGAFDDATGNDKPVGYTPSDVGIKISLPGVDVRSAPLYKQVFNSNCDYLKFHSTKIIKITFDNFANGQSSVDFIHGLGYVPVFLAYGYFDTSIQEHQLPVGRSPQPLILSAFADLNKITVEACWAGSGSHNTINLYVRVVVFKNNLLSSL